MRPLAQPRIHPRHRARLHIDHRRACLDHCGANHARLSCRNHQDVCTARMFGQVARFGCADGDGRAFLQEHQRHWLADYIAAAHHYRVLPLDWNTVFLQHVHHAMRGAWRKNRVGDVCVARAIDIESGLAARAKSVEPPGHTVQECDPVARNALSPRQCGRQRRWIATSGRDGYYSARSAPSFRPEGRLRRVGFSHAARRSASTGAFT